MESSTLYALVVFHYVVYVFALGMLAGRITKKPTMREAAEIMAKESHRIKEILKPQRRYIPRG